MPKAIILASYARQTRYRQTKSVEGRSLRNLSMYSGARLNERGIVMLRGAAGPEAAGPGAAGPGDAVPGAVRHGVVRPGAAVAGGCSGRAGGDRTGGCRTRGCRTGGLRGAF